MSSTVNYGWDRNEGPIEQYKLFLSLSLMTFVCVVAI